MSSGVRVGSQETFGSAWEYPGCLGGVVLPAHLAVVAPAPMKGPGAHQSRVPFFRRFLVSCPDDEVGMNEPGIAPRYLLGITCIIQKPHCLSSRKRQVALLYISPQRYDIRKDLCDALCPVTSVGATKGFFR